MQTIMDGLLEYQIARRKLEAFSTFWDSVLPYPVPVQRTAFRSFSTIP